MAVLRAFDGEQALEMIQRRKPDLLILDLMLPDCQDWTSAGFCVSGNIPKPCPSSW
jgi:DNA-binding response OmpR family regulator